MSGARVFNFVSICRGMNERRGERQREKERELERRKPESCKEKGSQTRWGWLTAADTRALPRKTSGLAARPAKGSNSACPANASLANEALKPVGQNRGTDGVRHKEAEIEKQRVSFEPESSASGIRLLGPSSSSGAAAGATLRAHTTAAIAANLGHSYVPSARLEMQHALRDI